MHESLTSWPAVILDNSLAAGFFVITFSTRDMGLSTSFADKCLQVMELEASVYTGQVVDAKFAAAAP